MAALSIEIVTSTGSSEEQLAAVGAAADSASAQLAGVEIAAAKVGPGLGAINTSSATATAAFGSMGTATGAAEAALASMDVSAATTAASMDAMTASMGTLATALPPVAAGATAIDGAMTLMAASIGAASTATGALATGGALGVEAMGALAASATPLATVIGGVARGMEESGASAIRETVHYAHFADSAAKGTVSMRLLGSVLASVSGTIDKMAASVGLTAGPFIALGLAVAVTAFEMIKSVKDAQELDAAITGMAHGVAEGMGITTEAFKKETDAAADAAGISKSSAEEIGQAFIKTGNASTNGLRDTIESATRYARLMGITVPEAMKVYADAFKDPIKGMADLGNGIVEFTAAQQKQIVTLVAQGKASEAAAIEMAVLKEKTDELAKSGTSLSGAWAATKNGFGSAIEGMVDLAAWVGRTSVAVVQFASTILPHTSSELKAWGQGFVEEGKILAAWGQGFVREGVLIETFFKELNYGTPIVGALANAFATATGKITALEDEENKAAAATQKINEFTKTLVQTEQDKINKLNQDKTALVELRKELAAGTGDQTALKAAIDAQVVSIQTQTQAMKDAVAAAVPVNKALTDMTALQDQETKASDAAAASKANDTGAVKANTSAIDDNIAALKAQAAADLAVAQTAEEAATSLQAAGQAMSGGSGNVTNGWTVDGGFVADVGQGTSAVNSLTSAANSASSALNGVGSGGGGGGGGGDSAGGGPLPGGAYPIPNLNAGATHDATLIQQFKDLQASLQSAFSALGQIGPPPTAPPPPKESAGATVASQPGAFGGDKNASFFFDPATRQTFLGQFGIKGDAATKESERQYQEQVKAYQLQLQQYNDQKAFQEKQIALMIAQLAALAKTDLSPGHGTAANPIAGQKPWYAPNAASGADWVVNGSPGQDRNIIPIALSHGELVSVTPPGESRSPSGAGGGQPVTVNLTISTPDVASFKQSRSSVVNHVSSMLAAATKNRTTNAR